MSEGGREGGRERKREGGREGERERGGGREKGGVLTLNSTLYGIRMLIVELVFAIFWEFSVVIFSSF